MAQYGKACQLQAGAFLSALQTVMVTVHQVCVVIQMVGFSLWSPLVLIPHHNRRRQILLSYPYFMDKETGSVRLRKLPKLHS